MQDPFLHSFPHSGVKLPTLTEKKPNKKGNEVSQITYNLPGSAVIRVLYKGRVLGERTIDVAQLGVDVPLPKNLFTNGDLPKIVFNEKTGNIISISK